MTGYLRRLATSARSPTSRLHPFVGSMFVEPPPAPLSPRGEAVAESEGRDAAPASTGAMVHADPPLDDTLLEPADPPKASAPAARARRRDEPQIDEQRNGARETAMRPREDPPSVARDGFRPLLGSLETMAVARMRDAAEAQPALLRSQPLGIGVDHPDPAHATESPPHEPSPAPARGGASPWDIAQPALATVPGPVRRSDADEARAGGRPRPPSGDDVHIYIGRVEVTAVPPSAPRPLRPTARKTMTLAEYLGRRDGAPR